MRVLVQRVREARVTVAKRVIGEIGYGFLIFVCAVDGDSEADAELLAQKIGKLRILRDDQGKMNRSILDVGGEALVVEGLLNVPVDRMADAWNGGLERAGEGPAAAGQS